MAERSMSFQWIKNLYIIRRHSTNFFSRQWAGGVVLVIFASLALVFANSDITKHLYHHLLETRIGIDIGLYNFSLTVEQWINDALMGVFFFVVGLEIKREVVAGQLSSVRQASLPIAAAVGGMAVPALIYIMFNNGTAYEPGWGIPMATDIAFALGILSLLGDRVPLSLKIFLTALAIVDDLGAILVIAFFYTSNLDFTFLLAGLALLAVLALMNRAGIRSVLAYFVIGTVVWFMFLNSGVHATIAGVLVAMTIPTTPRFSRKYFTYKSKYFIEEFKHYDREGVEIISNDDQMHALTKLKYVSNSTISPAQRLEHFLNPIVTFIVMPIFALANAGVEIVSPEQLNIFSSTQGMGIFFGLVLGKPVGILLFSWLMIKSGLSIMPEKGNWKIMAGVACLGGIGFTMSIFIDGLAFAGTDYIDPGKISILLASITSAIIGALWLNRVAHKGELHQEKKKN